ncbi:hypothetical protein RvY_01383 [Ramazzottius varieornatus]|uniref:RRM domain-containing protein n=1 Tax=Ramazzottius varieornatus TaxID=947166 RepID=A0A1D1UK30_RAMVA|nr:hypothetical protein RvY_01383 [Ramazzottius varieornatus]
MEAETESSAVLPPKGIKQNGKGGGASARKEKRAQWWAGNMEKRLSGQDGSPKGATRNESNPSSMLPRKRKLADPKDNDDPTEGAPGKDVSNPARQVKGNTPFTIFIGQIPFDAKEEEVRKLFETAGAIKTFRWRINPETKKFKGFAFVDYENKNGFKRSFQLHHSIICGRPINVEATITGGRKSRHRAVHIKDRTAKLQQEAKEAIERKARDAAKKKANRPPQPATDATSESKPEVPKSEPGTEVLPSVGRKRERTAKSARANKRLKAEAGVIPSASDAVGTVKAEPPTPNAVPAEKKFTSGLPTAASGGARADNFVKPRQEHLAALSNAKNHIKFED